MQPHLQTQHRCRNEFWNGGGGGGGQALLEMCLGGRGGEKWYMHVHNHRSHTHIRDIRVDARLYDMPGPYAVGGGGGGGGVQGVRSKPL